MHEIGHLHAFRRFSEMMLMMPEPVGAAALFVHKTNSFIDLRDLCHPVYPKPGKRAQPVLDDLTGVNLATVARRQDGEPHLRWSDRRELTRISEKIPDLF